MKLNYIMHPENFQPRPRSSYRIKEVSQTFSPMSRAGRRVQGEAKATATVAGNAKKEEEDRAKEFTKFVKTLNKVAGQRRAAPHARKAVEVDSASRPTRTSDRLQRLTAWLARSANAASSGSRLSRNREAATEPIWRRAVKRVKVKIAMSSTVKPEDIPRLHGPINRIQVVANVIDTNEHQTLVGPADARLVDGGIPYGQFPSADTIRNQLGFNQHPVHGVITPRLSHDVKPVAHQDVLFPGPETRSHDYLELERTAVACAYMGMGDEPMDLSPNFPSLVANDDYRNLEWTAIACAYAAIEPMDTTLDDTQGPMTFVVHQNVPPFIDLVGNLLEPRFDHAVTFQQPVYETLRPPGHQHLIDHLWPPAYAHIDNQIPPQPFQERFVNENLPLHQYYQAGHYPQGEEYLGLLPAFGHNTPAHPVIQQVFYEQDIPRMTLVQQQAEIHHQHIGHAVHFHPGVQEERIDQGPVQQHLDGLVAEHGVGGNWNASGSWRHAGEEGQHDNPGFFVDVIGGNVVEQEEPNRHTGEAHILDRIEVLFGDSGEEDSDSDDDDDDDYEGNKLQIIF